MTEIGRSLRIAVGGSMANPPHFGHAALVRAVLKSKRFDVVIWTVAGARADKPLAASPDDRVAMTILAFEHEMCSLLHPPSAPSRVQERPLLLLRFDDAYRANTPTIEKLDAIRTEFPHAEIVWMTGIDVLVPQQQFRGKSEVAATWVHGERLLRDWRCVVLPREGYPAPTAIALPPRAMVIPVRLPNISSSEIRRRVNAGEPFREFVVSRVGDYITWRKLYQTP